MVSTKATNMIRPRIRKFVLLGAGGFVVVPTWLALAQSGAGPSAPNFVQDLWNIAQQAGPFGAAITFYFLMRSEAERRSLLAERNELLERVLTAINNGTSAIRDIRQLLGPSRDAS
jgi:hypothetical protein